MLSANWKKRPTIDTIERHFSSARWSEIFVPTQVDALTIIDLILDVISRIVQNILKRNYHSNIFRSKRENCIEKSTTKDEKKPQDVTVASVLCNIIFLCSAYTVKFIFDYA